MIAGPNGCVCGFNGDCNCRFELSADAEQAPAPKAKRAKSKSPTQRTLEECRKRGWTAQVVERWNPHAKVRVDLFGVIDLLAMGGGRILAIQACAGASHAARRAKILAEPRARQWIASGGRLELWSWSQCGAAGARKLWTLRIEAFATDSWPPIVPCPIHGGVLTEDGCTA